MLFHDRKELLTDIGTSEHGQNLCIVVFILRVTVPKILGEFWDPNTIVFRPQSGIALQFKNFHWGRLGGSVVKCWPSAWVRIPGS